MLLRIAQVMVRELDRQALIDTPQRREHVVEVDESGASGIHAFLLGSLIASTEGDA